MFNVENYSVSIKGLAPGFIMHNGMMADPQNPYAQKKASLKGKKAAGEEVRRQMRDADFLGSLYVEKGRIVLPQQVMQACLFGGGSSVDKMKGKGWVNGMTVSDNALLIYDGPEDPDQLKDVPEFDFTVPVVIGQGKSAARVMATRPIFKKWSAVIPVEIETDVLDRDLMEKIFQYAGRYVGVGDWRPAKKGKYGRFEVVDVVAEVMAEAA